LLAHAPDSPAATQYRMAAEALTVREGASDRVAERFRSAVIPDQS
jgi:septum site-determining protein MinD